MGLVVTVDDIRDLGADIICRSAEVAKRIEWGYVDRLYLDHDLGHGMDGHRFLKWLMDKKNCPRVVTLVSSNPVGKQNQANVLTDNGYTTKDGSTFVLSPWGG